MPVKLTPKELDCLGYTEDPNDPTQLVRIADVTPAKSVETDVLLADARKLLTESAQYDTAALSFGRRSAASFFRAGESLDQVIDRMKEEKLWCKALDQHDISRTTAWEAIQLFRRAKTAEAIDGMTLTEAKLAFGVAKPPKKGGNERVATDADDGSDEDGGAARQQEKPQGRQAGPPPAKEPQDSITMRLAKLQTWTDLIRADMETVDADEEALDHCATLIDQIVEQLGAIKAALRANRD
jgi:hypothetical protein